MNTKFKLMFFSILINFSSVVYGQYIRDWNKVYSSLQGGGSMHNVTGGLPGTIYTVGISYDSLTKLDINFLKLDTAGNIVWQTLYNSADSLDDYTFTILHDGIGNIYTTGITQVDTSAGVYYDIISLKLNDNGSIVWQQRFNNPQQTSDNPVKAMLNSNCELIVAGSWLDTLLVSHSFLLLYDSSGVLLWNQPFPFSGLIDMDIDSNNNMYVLYGDNDSLGVLKYNSNGILIWNSAVADIAFSSLKFLRVDNDGEVVVCGSIATPLITLPHLSCTKLDTTGSIQWVKHFMVDTVGHQMWEVTLDSQGNIYCGGYDDTHPVKYFLSKLSSSGDSLWTTFASPGLNYYGGDFWDLKIITDENLLFTTSSYIPTNVDFAKDQVTYLIDSAGIITYQDIFDCGTGDDVFYSIGFDEANSIFLAGYVTDTLLLIHTASIVKYINPFLEVKTSSPNSKFTIGPNPLNNFLNIFADVLSDCKIKVELFDFTGKLIFNANHHLIQGQNQFQINTRNFNNGMYLIRVSNNNYDYKSRIVITR